MVASQAERNPESTAVAAPGRSPLTYRGLLSQVQHVGKTLNVLGMGRNSRVVVVLPNGPEMAVVFLAVSAAATCAPLNPAFTESEFGAYLSDMNAEAIIVKSANDSLAIKAAQDRGIPIIQLLPASEGPAGTFALTGSKRSPARKTGYAENDDVAFLLHTSGATSHTRHFSRGHIVLTFLHECS